MILLVGDKDRLSGISEVIETRTTEDYDYINESHSILEQENDILAYQDVSYIIYDIDQYFDDTEEIIEKIKAISRTNKAKVILYVKTDNPKNEVIKEAVANGIKHFINEGNSLTSQKDEFEKILSGYYEANGREDIEKVKEEIEKDERRLNSFVKEIYEDSKREKRKEKTVIIKKKRESEVIIETLEKIFKLIFSILITGLVSISLVTLIYKDTRLALFDVLLGIKSEIFSLVGL